MADIYSHRPDWTSTLWHTNQDKLQAREATAELRASAPYNAVFLRGEAGGTGGASVRASTLQQAQKLHGNRAVQRFVQGQNTTSIQRESALAEAWARPWMRPRPSPSPTDSAFGLPTPPGGYSDHYQDLPREPYDPGHNPGYNPGLDAPGYGGGWDQGNNPGYNGGYRGDFGPPFDRNYDGGYGPGHGSSGGWGIGGEWEGPAFGAGGYGGGSALDTLGSILGGLGSAVAGTFGGVLNSPDSPWGDLTGGGGYDAGYGDGGAFGNPLGMSEGGISLTLGSLMGEVGGSNGGGNWEEMPIGGGGTGWEQMPEGGNVW